MEKWMDRRNQQANDMKKSVRKAPFLYGVQIWKYYGRTTHGKNLRIQRNWIVLAMLAIGIFLSMTFSGLFILAQKMNMNIEIIKWMITVALFLLTAVIVVIAVSVGRKTRGMEYAFARDPEGRMYIFYYTNPEFQRYLVAYGEKYQSLHVSGGGGIATVTSYFSSNRKEAKVIELVERYQIIEKIMEQGKIYPYGHEILRVESVQQKLWGSKVKCVLGNADGSSYQEKLLLPDDYENYQQLLTYLEMKRIK